MIGGDWWWCKGYEGIRPAGEGSVGEDGAKVGEARVARGEEVKGGGKGGGGACGEEAGGTKGMIEGRIKREGGWE